MRGRARHQSDARGINAIRRTRFTDILLSSRDISMEYGPGAVIASDKLLRMQVHGTTDIASEFIIDCGYNRIDYTDGGIL